jgi:phytoene dehydrogenase-like protein
LFTNNYQQEFELLFSGERIYEDPTVYIHITSKLNKEDAPEGAENWFVLINAPAHKGQNWETIVSETRQNTIKKINSHLNTDIEKAIVCEEILTPENIEQKTFSYQGSLYGSSSNNRNAAFMRQANFSSKIKGLYFCGGSVHPGGGIPLVLSSAQIVADLIE